MYRSIDLSIYLFAHLQVWKRSYSARLPQFLNLTTSEAQQFCETFSIFELDNAKKRRNSARLPQILNLTMSKTKLRDFLNFRSWQCQKRSCETSSIFEVDNVKKEAFLRDFLQTCKVECRAGGLVPMRFVIFPLHLCKVLRLPRKSDASSYLYEVLHLSRKIMSANLKIWCSKMQPPSGSQRPDLRTSLMNMSLVARLPRKMHLYRSSSNAPRLPSFLEMLQNLHVLLTLSHFWQGPQSLAPATRNDIWTSKSGPSMWCFYVFFTFWLRNVLRATTACTFSTLELPKVAQTWGVFSFFTCKCASRHNGVHFFDIVTAKSPDLVCFVHFDFEMCFAPQRRALFGFIRHLNFQNWSELAVFLAFSLANVLRATMACIFSTSQLPKVVRSWGVLHILTWKWVSRHNSVQFFISHLASEPTFRASGATNHWKNTKVSRLCACIFFPLTLSLL